MKKIFIALFLSFPVLVFAFELPTGQAWTVDTLATLLDSIASFLIYAGITLGVIAIVYAGIVFFTHSFNPKAVENARGILKSAIIGVAIVVGFGVIINTISAVITGNFWGGGGTSNTNNTGEENLPGSGGSVTVTLGELGQPCTISNECNYTNLKCNSYADTSICVRKEKNRKNESCWDDNDCQSNNCVGASQNGQVTTYGVCQ